MDGLRAWLRNEDNMSRREFLQIAGEAGMAERKGLECLKQITAAL